MRIEPGLGLWDRAGEMDERGDAATLVAKHEGLAPSRLPEDGETKVGRHREGALRLHDGEAAPKPPTWSLKPGTVRSLAGVFRMSRPVPLALDHSARSWPWRAGGSGVPS